MSSDTFHNNKYSTSITLENSSNETVRFGAMFFRMAKLNTSAKGTSRLSFSDLVLIQIEYALINTDGNFTSFLNCSALEHTKVNQKICYT